MISSVNKIPNHHIKKLRNKMLNHRITGLGNQRIYCQDPRTENEGVAYSSGEGVESQVIN